MRDERLSEQEHLMLDYWEAWVKAYAHFNPDATPSLEELMVLFAKQGPVENHALIQRYADAIERQVRDTMCN